MPPKTRRVFGFVLKVLVIIAVVSFARTFAFGLRRRKRLAAFLTRAGLRQKKTDRYGDKQIFRVHVFSSGTVLLYAEKIFLVIR